MMTPLQRFESKLVPLVPSSCWTLDGAFDKDGYALFSYKNITRRGHRISWVLHHGEIPDGMLVCHSCDNPACVKPDHLFLGTHADNIADKVRKGRQAKGPTNANTKLSPSDITTIGEMMRSGRKAKEIAPLFGVTPARIWQLFPGY